MIDFNEIASPEVWELFARDFLADMGFSIISSPDRGADEGKDFLVSENVQGLASLYTANILVSCKHNVISGKSVIESDELNILERMKAFRADGFIGIYSTVPSAALNTRLKRLTDAENIKFYKIFDHKLIEKELIENSNSRLLARYFPESYDRIKPIRTILNKYIPILCEVCGEDLLKKSFSEAYSGNIIYIHNTKTRVIEKVCCTCKGKPCDMNLELRILGSNQNSGWVDLQDLFIPSYFLHHTLSILNSVRNGSRKYTDAAWAEEKDLLMSIAQRVLMPTTKREHDRLLDLLQCEF